MEKVSIHEEHTKIIRLWLEKLNDLTPEERAEVLKIIKWINHPIFLNH